MAKWHSMGRIAVQQALLVKETNNVVVSQKITLKTEVVARASSLRDTNHH